MLLPFRSTLAQLIWNLMCQDQADTTLLHLPALWMQLRKFSRTIKGLSVKLKREKFLIVLAGFQFTSFEFVDNDDPIIIECDIVICDPDGGDCVVCASRKRRNADSLKALTTSVTLNMQNLNP